MRDPRLVQDPKTKLWVMPGAKLNLINTNKYRTNTREYLEIISYFLLGMLLGIICLNLILS